MSNYDPNKWLNRSRELKASGLESWRADHIATLEERISQWPPEWGENLEILIFGDFQPPSKELVFPTLGITVYPEKQENTIAHRAICVLKASVKVKERSIAEAIEAAKRVNRLLGALTLVEWGNGAVGWWSIITHVGSGGVLINLDHADLPRAVEGIVRLEPEMARKVDAALYWIQEPGKLGLWLHRGEILRVYSAYWNAFECLVEAVSLARPMPKSSRNERQARLEQFIARRKAPLTLADIEECYQRVVNPGFVGKASHALRVCFGEEAKDYIHECFGLPDKRDRLYDIRNAINHGDIDAEDPQELARVKSQLNRLTCMVLRIFGLFTPFPVPANTNPNLQPRSPGRGNT